MRTCAVGTAIRFAYILVHLGRLVACFAGPRIVAAPGFEFFEPVRPPRSFQVMAHRGEARQAPENTRPALDRCIEDGLEWAEVDVRLTGDGQHVLSHEDRLAAGGSPDWRVSGHTLAELQRLDLGVAFASRFQGERVLTLADCLELARHRLNLYLDCKAVNPEQLAAEILQAGMERQVVVFDRLEHLRRVHAASAGRIAIMAKWHPDCGIQPWATAHHLAAVEIDAHEVTPEVCRAFHALGVKVQTKNLGAWDRPEFWDKSVEAGADWLQTDLPEELIAHRLRQRFKAWPVRFSLHRGAGRYAPENTLPAFEKAIRMGADFVEFDVRTTSDGKFYLLHDRTVDRTTDGSGPLTSLTSAMVDRLSAGSGFSRAQAPIRVPTLDEFMTAIQGRAELYFDAKAISPEALAESVERHRLETRTVVYQSPDYLLRLKEINPRIRRLPPLRSVDHLEGLAATLKPYAVDASWEILSKDLISRCHALNIQVFSDALGRHERVEDYLQAIEWGIDLIQTDHPLRLMRAFEVARR